VIVSSYTIDRGRSYELDQNSPGTASVTLIDTTGELDPSGGGYAFDPGTPGAIALRNPVTGTDHTIFRGHVTRIDYDLYQNEKYATVTVDMVDGLDRLASMEMFGGQGWGSVWGDFPRLGQDGDVSFFADDQSNAVANRINKVLDQANWANGLREVFSGNVSLQGTVYAHRTPALTAIQDAADAEFPGVANFYIQKDGKATFHGRLARFQPDSAQYHIAKWRCGDMAAVAADSSRALIFELAYDRDVEKVINSAQATPQNIPDAAIDNQRVENTASIAQYGSRTISFDNLLTAGDPDGQGYGYTPAALPATLKFATYYADNYAQPRTRVNKITFKRVGPQDAYAPRLWALMCGVDISDIIRLKTTHLGGGFDGVDGGEDFYVEGLHYTASPLSDQYVDVELTLDVSPRAYYDVNPGF
jgi:hypothetical protein